MKLDVRTHSLKSSYLVFSILFVAGIVVEKWEVIIYVTIGFIVHSLLLRDKPTPSTDRKPAGYTRRLGDRNLRLKERGSYKYKVIMAEDDQIH